jgi:hypothetical protein
MPGKHADEERMFCLRRETQDIVLGRFTVDKPDSESKVREEFYYRTTVQGDLVLALTATFQFTIDDVDNELLKKVTWQTYGEVAGDGTKPLPITPDLKAEFEAEKKLWLAVEKKLSKQRRAKKE